MFRKNQSQSGGRRGFGAPGQRDQKKSQAQAPKQVSPNYRVNMMHHNASSQQQSTNYPSSGPARQGGGGFGPPKPRVNFDRPPAAPHARKGFQNINVELKEDLYHAFNEKLKVDGKTSKEAISQLVSFYVMGKINV